MGGRMTMPAEPIDQMRERFRGIWAGVKPMLPSPSDAVQTKDVDFALGKIVRIYVPINRGLEIPVGLYIHSGGWCSGDIEQEDFLCREIAEKCGIILYSPEYRLAPEDPYPAVSRMFVLHMSSCMIRHPRMAGTLSGCSSWVVLREET